MTAPQPPSSSNFEPLARVEPKIGEEEALGCQFQRDFDPEPDGD